MERRSLARITILLLVIGAAGCQPPASQTLPGLAMTFAGCSRTEDLPRQTLRLLTDQGFDALDLFAAAQMTGRIPAHPIDIVAVNARDDAVQIDGDFDEKAASGFVLRIGYRHRPDLRPDSDMLDRLRVFATRTLGCQMASSEEAKAGPNVGAAYQTFAKSLRLQISRYR